MTAAALGIAAFAVVMAVAALAAAVSARQGLADLKASQRASERKTMGAVDAVYRLIEEIDDGR